MYKNQVLTQSQAAQAAQSAICGTNAATNNPISHDLEQLRVRISRFNRRLERVICGIRCMPPSVDNAKQPGAPDMRTTVDQCASGMYFSEMIMSDIERELFGSDQDVREEDCGATGPDIGGRMNSAR